MKSNNKQRSLSQDVSRNNFVYDLSLIEGYYGNLLDWKSRKKIIQKMREIDMNFYFYAPKEDINHRLKWRKPYKKLWRNRFRTFCSFANSNNIEIETTLARKLPENI